MHNNSDKEVVKTISDLLKNLDPEESKVNLIYYSFNYIKIINSTFNRKNVKALKNY